MPGPIDLSGQIPPEYSTQIIQEATQQSAALSLGTKIPMGTGVSQMPVPKTFPNAAFVAAPGGRKPYTDLMLENVVLTAEEIAAVVSVPDVYLQDTSINLWGYVRPLLAEAIAVSFDNAVFWGTGAPPSYPVGGIEAAAQTAAAGEDALATANAAMGLVEGQGLMVTGNAADVSVKGLLRGVRDASGALLLGPDQANNPAMASVYGVPTYFTQFDPAGAGATDFITGAWKYLLVGVRQDIQYKLSSEGVIADGAGAVVVSAFQDNQTLLKVWARLAVQIVKPVTRRSPAGANPFALADLSTVAVVPPAVGE